MKRYVNKDKVMQCLQPNGQIDKIKWVSEIVHLQVKLASDAAFVCELFLKALLYSPTRPLSKGGAELP